MGSTLGHSQSIKMFDYRTSSSLRPYDELLKSTKEALDLSKIALPLQEPPRSTPFPRQHLLPQEIETSGAPDQCPPGQKVSIENYVDPRIVNGKRTSIYQIPWQAALIFGDSPEDQRTLFCGASIVGYRWILTAAHCLRDVNGPDDVDVVVGATYPRSREEGERLKVSRIIPHPDYDDKYYLNDIALLELKTPVRKGEIALLPRPDFPIQVGGEASISGWGLTREGGTPSGVLLSAKIPIISNEECSSEQSYGSQIKSMMFCAGNKAGGVDACQGDSGGPVMVTTVGTKRQVQIGVVSWGTGCARRLMYGVYTNVPQFVGWIQATMAGKNLASR
jgi:transmembrane serine protease 11D